MKNLMKRGIGVLMATMSARVSGTATAEMDCSVDMLESLPKGSRIERAYACADRLNNSAYLFNLAADLFHAAACKGWLCDREQAHDVHHDFPDRAETLPVGTLGSMDVEVAYRRLAEFHTGETRYNQFWPRDPETAEYYSDLHIDRLKQRGVNAEELGQR